MGWLSRTFRPDAGDVAEGRAPADGGPAAPSVPAPSVPVPAAGERTAVASSPQGRYGPLVSVTRFDTAAPELEWQLPLNGELYRVVPGSDAGSGVGSGAPSCCAAPACDASASRAGACPSLRKPVPANSILAKSNWASRARELSMT